MAAKRQDILSSNELLKIISDNQWCDTKTFIKISGKGTNRAYSDKKELQEELEAKGYKMPRGFLPMNEVVNYYKIDISYLKRITNINRR